QNYRCFSSHIICVRCWKNDNVGSSTNKKKKTINSKLKRRRCRSFHLPLSEYSPDVSTKSTTSAVGKSSKDVRLWEGFFEEVKEHTFITKKNSRFRNLHIGTHLIKRGRHKNDFGSDSENDSDDSVELYINLEALQESASKVFHMQCISIQKLSEEYIGRVAFPEYPRWKTESEVAVMEYVRLNTKIPVPKIYYWNSSIERLPGCHLCNVVEIDFFVNGRAMDRGPFNTTKEYVLAAI
ncbi:9903_t:CDS:2, partial [Racocetra persica]